MSSRHLIPRLLSQRDRLSRIEKDALLERVLRSSSPRRPWMWPAMLVFAGAAAALLLFLSLGQDQATKGEAELTAKGAASELAAFALSCRGASTCQQAEVLVFDLGAATGYRYFAAFARRDDGTVLWYFPEGDERQSLDLTARLPAGVLDRGVVLDGEHRPGRYEVFGIFSKAPLSRRDIKARFDAAAADVGPGTAVVKRELVIR